MSIELEKAKARTRLRATESGAELCLGVFEAVDRVRTGEFGEPAVAGEASIEQFATTGDHLPIKLFIQDAEEAVDYSPAELRRLAFNLLAMADVSEALHDLGPSGG